MTCISLNIFAYQIGRSPNTIVNFAWSKGHGMSTSCGVNGVDEAKITRITCVATRKPINFSKFASM